MPGLDIKVTGGLELERKLRDPNLLAIPLDRLLFKARRVGLKEARRRIEGGSGLAVQTVGAQAQIPQGRVVIGTALALKTALSIEEGRKPGSPPSIFAVLAWLRTQSIRASAIAVQGSIRRRGTPGKRFLAGAKEHLEQERIPRWLQEMGDAVRRKWEGR